MRITHIMTLLVIFAPKTEKTIKNIPIIVDKKAVKTKVMLTTLEPKKVKKIPAIINTILKRILLALINAQANSSASKRGKVQA